MATLRTYQSIQNDNYVFVFSIDPASISSDDVARINKFGAPIIDFGGSFNNGIGVSYTLPDIYFNLPADFPVQQTFSAVAPFDTNTMVKLALYASTIQTRITSAFTTLRGLTDTFTGETVNNI